MGILIIISAFFASLIFLIILRPLAFILNLIDYPTKRKDHHGNIPLIGGICIFFGLTFSYCVFIEPDSFFSILLIVSSLILVNGVWDDFVGLQAKIKMAFQILLTLTMIYITDVKLESFGYLFGNTYQIELGILSIPITIIAVVGLTNAINMIDGIDGLSSSLVLIAVLGLLTFDITLEASTYTYILLAVAFSILPFMILNIASFSKMKVFLGDGGSLFLGFMISWLLIYYAENIDNFSPSNALWYVTIPLFDFCTVIVLRIFAKRSLILADKNHIHHFLENLGFSKKLVLVLIVFLSLSFLLIGNFIEDKFPELSFSIFFVFFLFYLYTRIYFFKKKV